MNMILWDMDGVIYEGRGTTHLAKGSEEDPEKFIERFKKECGMEGPLGDIDPKKFEYALSQWEKDHREIKTLGDLGEALTDLRHEYGIFTSKHTKHTKNALLRGITLSQLNQIMDGVERMCGFESATNGFKRNGKKQMILSNASHPITVYFKEKYGMSYAFGLPVFVIKDEQEVLYTEEMYGNPKIQLAGRAKDGFNKLEHLKGLIYKEIVNPKEIAAIDDDSVEILNYVQRNGGLALGFNVKYEKRFQEFGIPIINENNLEIFYEIVMNPKDIWKYCR